MTNVINKITYIDTETTQLYDKVDVLEYGEVPSGENTGNQIIHKRMKPNSTTLIHPAAGATQNISCEDLNATDRVTTYNGALFINERLNTINSPIIAMHNSSFDLRVFNQNAFTNLLPPHQTSKKLVLETMEVFKTAAAIKPEEFDFFNDETGKHSVSLNVISKKLLHKEEIHRADADADYTKQTIEKVIRGIPEIGSLIKYATDDYNRNELFESPLLLKATLSPSNGPSFQLLTRLASFDWNNWDTMITIPEDFNWEEEISVLANELKKQAKPSVMKTKRMPILFPLESNTFKNVYPHYPNDKIKKIIHLLRNDKSFIEESQNTLRNKYSKPKEREYKDVFDNSDGFFSSNDNYTARLFHAGHPKAKYELCNEFEDQRLVTNSKIIMMHNFREVMNNKDIQDILDYELSELEKPEASRVTFEAFLKSYDEVCSDSKWPKHVIDNLNGYKSHVLALKANPKLFLEV